MMNKHHTSLYVKIEKDDEQRVVKQQLITLIETDFGLIETTLIRNFTNKGFTDTYSALPTVFENKKK